MASYNHKDIESKWQEKWEKDGLHRTKETSGKKFYILDMFPYPSGEGLHVGHPKGYIATDVYSRMKKMQGYDVLHPMGFDAFGLPAEQFALKNKVNPNISTAKNVARYKEQLTMLGLNYDWDREVNTTDPKFYKWTQWMWKQMYKQGLTHESYDPINWCPSCKTGLANEDLENGLCERCGSVVEKKPIRQWTIRITDYADRLLSDLDKLDWEPHIKELQKNWIGKSEGSEITFSLVDFPYQEKLTVFTTRPDTLYGVTFMAISRELAEEWMSAGWEAREEIRTCISEIKEEEKKQDFSFKEVLEKKGIDTGIKAINPVNGKSIPVWIANYVLSGYGTGALMAVPAHDNRDYGFATAYDLPIQQVLIPETGILQENPEERQSIVAIIFDKRTKKYLSLNWGTHLGGSLFIGGGIDKEEDVITAALREIKEETGYLHLTHISQTQQIYHNYFAHSKNVARRIAATGLLFELADDTKVETSLEENEKNKFTIEWLSEKEVLTKIKDELHTLVFSLLAKKEVYTGNGMLTNSEEFDGGSSLEAKKKITEKVGGKQTSQYKLKDWVFARQRYWGEPFPVVFDEHHTSYVVADKELPVVLPMVNEYEPTGTGESPLAMIKDWVEVYGYINADGEFESLEMNDPRAKLFKRETNTMPQWAGSSWYYLRYIDPHNADRFADPTKEKKWSPVDFYVGGAEHATRHLIYARFWHKFLFDLGLVTHDEPFTKLQTVGLIMAEDGRKMSKRWGNIVNPDDVINEYGADTLRLYEMFMGPFDQSVAWSTTSMAGTKRFLDRLVKLSEKISSEKSDDIETTILLNQTIKKVGEDIENFKFNTAISSLMILLNLLEKKDRVSFDGYITFTQLIAPFAPHVAEELWSEILKRQGSIHEATWPTYDESKLITDTVTIAIQIAGKMRGTINSTRGVEDAVLLELVQKHEMYQKYVGTNEPKKIIVIKDKIVNIVI